MRQEIRPTQLSTRKLAVFQITTDLHSDTPRWTTLSFLPEHLVLDETHQFISLDLISRIWVSNGLTDQVTCVAYKDQEGRTQTLAMRVEDGQGRVAGENLKALYRLYHSRINSDGSHPDTTPAWVRNLVGRFNDRKRKALI